MSICNRAWRFSWVKELTSKIVEVKRYIRVVCKVKQMKLWVQSQTLSSQESTVTLVFLMLKLPYTKSGVELLKTGFLVCATRMDGPS